MLTVWLLAAATGWVDRFEGPWVVIESRSGVIRVRRRQLPPGLREGDRLEAGRRDTAARARALRQARALLLRLRVRGTARTAPARQRVRGKGHPEGRSRGQSAR